MTRGILAPNWDNVTLIANREDGNIIMYFEK